MQRPPHQTRLLCCLKLGARRQLWPDGPGDGGPHGGPRLCGKDEFSLLTFRHRWLLELSQFLQALHSWLLRPHQTTQNSTGEWYGEGEINGNVWCGLKLSPTINTIAFLAIRTHPLQVPTCTTRVVFSLFLHRHLCQSPNPWLLWLWLLSTSMEDRRQTWGPGVRDES